MKLIASMDKEITNWTLFETSEAIRSGKVSSEEVTKAYLARIEKLNPKLNAYITVDIEGALASARFADDRIRKNDNVTALTGVPLGIKDIFVTKGLKTTCASKILHNWIPPYEGTPTRKLKEAGAVFLGKLNMDEFAMGSSNETSWFGPVLNPWDLNRTPGGSSGGSASAVSADLCAGALGTDTGGSIRLPSALTGIVGIKPTYGRVSRYGVIAFASSLDQVGPMGKCVRDCAILLKYIAGHDPLDSTSIPQPVPDYERVLNLGIKGVKIGVPKEYFQEGIQEDTLKAVREAIEVCKKLGAQVVDVSLPHTDYALATYYIIAPAEASSNLARYDGVKYGFRKESGGLMEMYKITRTEGFGAEVKRRIMLGTYVLSAGYYEAYYRKAMKVRTLIRKDFEEAFQKVDVLLCPTSPSTAFLLGEKIDDPLKMYLNDVLCVPVNMAGLPGMSLPCGFDSNGLPIGLQIIAPPLGEEVIFRVASAYEEATEWKNRKPPIR